MKTPARFVLWRYLVGLAALAAPMLSARAVTVTTLARLGGTPAGSTPEAALVLGADGEYYGTTAAGGLPNAGTIFKITTAGALANVHVFTGNDDGAMPVAGLVLGKDGNFYGTASAGGANGNGTVFKLTPAGALSVLHTFSAQNASTFTNADGAEPMGSLIQGTDGNFYGTAYQGGAHDGGTVFKITPAGAFTTLYSFAAKSDGSDGFNPRGALAQGADGNFYGVARDGGTADSYGTVFRLTSTGVLTTLHAFTGGADGDIPASLVRGADGNFYGLTEYGGSAQAGAAFKVTSAGVFSTLHGFSTTVDGSDPRGALIQGKDGNFYGTTSNRGPNNGYGTVFKMTPAGAVTVIYTFPLVNNSGGEGAADGASPAAAVVQAAGGNFYGTTAGGGALNGDTNGSGGGTVFQLNPAGALTKLYTFPLGGSDCSAGLLQTADGSLYGTTARGGVNGAGTVFVADTRGNVEPVHDFDPDTEGGVPGAAFILDKNGNVFGTATQGGSGGGGTLFQLVPDSETDPTRIAAREFAPATLPPNPNVNPDVDSILDTKYASTPGEIALDFIGSFGDPAKNAVTPQAATAETICGVASRGGPSQAGAIYTYTVGGGTNFVYEFGSQTDDGLSPQGITQGKDGNFYGTTSDGGTAGFGTVFKFVPGGTVTTLHSFTGSGDGACPKAGLIQGSDGNFYGTTAYTADDVQNGPTGSGTIFSITPAGVFKTLHTLASNASEGEQPMAKLLQASDGKLYGTTSTGGDEYQGTLFSITTAGAFARLYSFENVGGGGTRPLGALIQGADGYLYGTTAAGGPNGDGVIYRVVLTAPPVITSAATATATEGAAFQYQITASNAPTSYGVQGLPGGLTVNGTTGFISGKPTATGTRTLTLNAYNAAGKGSATLTLTIKAPAPVITSAATASSTTGHAFSYQITATGSPTSYGVQGLPGELAVNASTGLISGAPKVAGKYTLTLNAYNASGKGSAPLMLTVALGPPIITSAATASGKVGTAFSYQIMASGSPTSYGVQGLPGGLTINSTSGLISGTPKVSGTFTLTLNAYNSAGKGSATLTLTVTN